MELLQKAELIEKDYKGNYKDYYRNYAFYASLIEEYGKEKGNKMTVLISYLYDKNSHFLNTKLERKEAKIGLLKKLGFELDDDFLQLIESTGSKEDGTDGKLKILNDAIEEYLDAQKDWKFKQVMIYYDYHSTTIRFSKNTIKDPKQLLDMGKALEEGENRRRSGDALLQEIEKDFAQLNGALIKEGRKKITVSHTWEQFINNKEYA
jgi:hypothetical protein